MPYEVGDAEGGNLAGDMSGLPKTCLPFHAPTPAALAFHNMSSAQGIAAEVLRKIAIPRVTYPDTRFRPPPHRPCGPDPYGDVADPLLRRNELIADDERQLANTVAFLGVRGLRFSWTSSC